MSRSNPSTETRNPSNRWFEWGGKEGTVRYYDRDQKKNVEVGDNFTFILLDELSTVKGWSDEFSSGIGCNEVKSVSDCQLTVKIFKGPVIAKGLYSDIKDKVKAAGGRFTANCYIAFKDADQLKLGSLQLKGASLNAWVEFKKLHLGEIYQSSIKIVGSTDAKKGSVKFKVPKFEMSPCSAAMNEEANKLDVILQAYLKQYLAKNEKVSNEGSQPDLPEDRQDHTDDDDVDDRQTTGNLPSPF